MLDDSKKAGEEIKKTALSRAKKIKTRLAFGLGAVGAVVGTVATMGAGGAIIGGVAGGLAGGFFGKKKENIEKKIINNTEF